MKLAVDDEFGQICNDIASENLNLSEWREIESDDMFQTANYCGGFDATEDAFCFSYHQSENREFWFQITFDEISKILSGEITEINARQADF